MSNSFTNVEDSNHIPKRVGFVSTRLAGTDGVSLETSKWADVLETMGVDSFYFAGEIDHSSSQSHLARNAHFSLPEIMDINQQFFTEGRYNTDLSHRIQELQAELIGQLTTFVNKFRLEVLIVQNALSLPMNLPLGLALTEFIAQTGIQTIAHHHDFWWERPRFTTSVAPMLLHKAFPPNLPSIRHVVINSLAQQQLALRLGVQSVLVPNVMDFDTPPDFSHDRTAQLRDDLKISVEDTLILQPTRVVPRKRIEIAIELVHRLGEHAVLLVSHDSGDEGDEYQQYLINLADNLGIRMIFAADIIENLDRIENARDSYSLKDAYRAADLVSYPSSIEGFGNALLEAFYFQKPVVNQEYEVFRVDIKPKGFETIGFNDFLDRKTFRAVQEVLNNPSAAERMVKTNFQLGRRHYSLSTLRRAIHQLLR